MHKGYPVPYVTKWDDVRNCPDFTRADPYKWAACVNSGRCAGCGNRLATTVWFVGGIRSIESRLFVDPGMHESCIRYMIAVCPYFLGRSYDNGDEPFDLHEEVMLTRPPVMYLYRTSNYKVVEDKASKAVYLQAEPGTLMESWT